MTGLLIGSSGSSDVQQRLVRAIYADEVGSVAAQLLDDPSHILPEADRDLLEQAARCCKAISRQMRDVRAESCCVFLDAGLTPHFVEGPEDRNALQFHRTGIDLPRVEMERALELAEKAGFLAACRLSPGRRRALALTARDVSLVRSDENSTRLTLRPIEAPHTKLPLALRPTMADLALIDLPRPLAAGYVLIRVLRILAERLSRRRFPFAQTDYLGTPESLIGPLLNAAELSPEDRLIDLGCGDGRVVAAAVRDFGCSAIGVESNADIASRARRNLDKMDLDPSRAKIKEGSAESIDLSRASVIFVFLPAHILARILPNLIARAAAGARVIAHEQAPLQLCVRPEISLPLFADRAMTVAHLWRGRQKA